VQPLNCVVFFNNQKTKKMESTFTEEEVLATAPTHSEEESAHEESEHASLEEETDEESESEEESNEAEDESSEA
jgi:hypothetical protein